VVFYGLADLALAEVIEIFNAQADAEAALRAVLHDEPGWASTLTIARLEYRDGVFEIELGRMLASGSPVPLKP
jgi:hypothetical protein